MIDAFVVFGFFMTIILSIAILIIWLIIRNEKAKSAKKSDERKMKRFMLKYNQHIKKSAS